MRFLHEFVRKIGMAWYIIWYIKFTPFVSANVISGKIIVLTHKLLLNLLPINQITAFVRNKDLPS